MIRVRHFIQTGCGFLARRDEKLGFVRFTGAFSTDGVSWQQVGSVVEIEISGRVMVGLVATVQSDRSTSVSVGNVLASFSDVTVAPR